MPSILRQFTTGTGKKIALGIVISLAVITVIFNMICGILKVDECSTCGKITIGKQDAIKDKPVCEKCYNERYE